jgi:hypothetical protein
MKTRARVVAVVREHPFQAAVDSLRNALELIVDFMYGTPERARITVTFACMLAVLGFILQATSDPVLTVCPIQ